MLDVIDTCRLSQRSDSLDFLRVSFNASFRNQKTQELAYWHTKDTPGQVKHHLVDPEIVKGLFQIIYQGLLLPGFHNNIIHISMNIASNLVKKAILNTPLISCLGTLEPTRHRYIAEGSKGSDESCLLLVLNC